MLHNAIKLLILVHVVNNFPFHRHLNIPGDGEENAYVYTQCVFEMMMITYLVVAMTMCTVD
jgi:hypothetical protein